MTRPAAVRRDATLRRRIGGGAILLAAAVVAGLLALLRFTGSMQADLARQTAALLIEQTLADLIHRNVSRQLLDASRYVNNPRPELLESFRQHGAEVYSQVRKYLFHDLSLSERLQVEKVKELHQEFEVAAQQAFDLLDQDEARLAQVRINVMFAQVSELEEALDRFIAMRVETRDALRGRRAVVSGRLYGAVALLGAVFVAVLLLFVRLIRSEEHTV